MLFVDGKEVAIGKGSDLDADILEDLFRHLRVDTNKVDDDRGDDERGDRESACGNPGEVLVIDGDRDWEKDCARDGKQKENHANDGRGSVSKEGH